MKARFGNNVDIIKRLDNNVDIKKDKKDFDNIVDINER